MEFGGDRASEAPIDKQWCTAPQWPFVAKGSLRRRMFPCGDLRRKWADDDGRRGRALGEEFGIIVGQVDEEIQQELKMQRPEGVAVFEVIGNYAPTRRYQGAVGHQGNR